MIVLTDELYLARIESQNMYMDWDSFERKTAKRKPKFKLAGNSYSESEVCPFWISTSCKESCYHLTTIKVQEKEWEDREPKALLGTSYIDMNKYEMISRDDILTKCKDCDNGFPTVARMPDTRFKEFLDLKKNIHRNPKVSNSKLVEVNDLIQTALTNLGI